MSDLMEEMNQDGPNAGFISYADDFFLKSTEEDPNEVWKKTASPLSDKGLKIDRPKSSYTQWQGTEWTNPCHARSTWWCQERKGLIRTR